MITLPNSYKTDVLNEEQLEVLASLLPQPKSNTGRPSYSNKQLLPGILRVLRSGMRWRDLDDVNLPSGVTHWRRLRFWNEKLGLRNTLENLIKILLNEDKLDLRCGSLDGSLIPSFNFADTTGYSGKHNRTGTKISNLVDFQGIPLNTVFAPGNTHDIKLALPTIMNCLVKILKLLADKGYDSDDFRLILRSNQIEPNIPNRNIKNRIKDPNYNPTLNKMRFKIERTQAWMKSFRRVRFRFDYTLKSFSAFVFLTLIVILVKKIV